MSPSFDRYSYHQGISPYVTICLGNFLPTLFTLEITPSNTSFTSISNARDQVYQLIDTMCNDSAVSAIVRTYTDDVCEMADNGHIV